MQHTNTYAHIILFVYNMDICDREGVFKSVRLGYLMVGHTHDIVDQLFSRISEHLLNNNIFTLEEYKAQLPNMYSMRREKLIKKKKAASTDNTGTIAKNSANTSTNTNTTNTTTTNANTNATTNTNTHTITNSNTDSNSNTNANSNSNSNSNTNSNTNTNTTTSTSTTTAAATNTSCTITTTSTTTNDNSNDKIVTDNMLKSYLKTVNENRNRRRLGYHRRKDENSYQYTAKVIEIDEVADWENWLQPIGKILRDYSEFHQFEIKLDEITSNIIIRYRPLSTFDTLKRANTEWTNQEIIMFEENSGSLKLNPVNVQPMKINTEGDIITIKHSITCTHTYVPI